jgi:hypothetical protein
MEAVEKESKNVVFYSDGTVVNAPGITTIEKAEQYLKEKK